MLEICKAELPAIFATAGAKCESLGYCPESPRFACGKHPTKEALLSAQEHAPRKP
jgi:thymidylate synthase (FAD)